MFKTIWGPDGAVRLVALGGLFLLVFLAILSLAGAGDSPQQTCGQGGRDAQNSAQEECNAPGGQSMVENFVSPQDTLAQWLMTLFSMLAVGVSGYAVYLVRQTYGATVAMAKDTRRIGEAQVRAYLSIEEAAVIPRAIGQDVVSWDFHFTFKNSGQSPASKVTAGVAGQGIHTDWPSILPDLSAGATLTAKLHGSTKVKELAFIGGEKNVVLLTVDITVEFADVFTGDGARNKFSNKYIAMVRLTEGKASPMNDTGSYRGENYKAGD